MDDLSQFKALTYFDIFLFPLTDSELKNWQWTSNSGVNIVNRSEKLGGFNFLSGRNKIILERQARYVNSVVKLGRARMVIKILRLLPSVKMIAVCNSLGYLNAKESSDIDLFILTSPGKIWLTRFWLQSLLKLLHLRPYDRGRKKDSICLTFFLSTDCLNVESLQVSRPDVYLTYWLSQLLPIYNPEGWYEKFIKNNHWVEEYLSKYQAVKLAPAWRVAPTSWSYFFYIFIFWWWEPILKKIQIKIMPPDLRQLANQDTRVILNDQILKFHGREDKRQEYSKLWQEKLGQKN
jgi:hypothetical protein